ncbi:MAG: hypothetical protein ACJ76H_11320 [Bacteriovoracaceae bacterium]
MIYFNKNAIKNKIQHVKCQVTDLFLKKKKAEENKKVDEASWESMDASDPPAHISKSTEDKVLH